MLSSDVVRYAGRLVLTGALAVPAVLAATHTLTHHASTARPATSALAFRGATAFSTPLPAAGTTLRQAAVATADPVAAALGQDAAVVNTGPYSTAVVTATPSTPRYHLHITHEGTAAGGWGDDVLAHSAVPIPTGVALPSGADAKLVVVDPAAGQVYDLWQPQHTAAGWSVSWGGQYPLAGNGVSTRVAYGTGPNEVPWPQPVSRGTGSGISSLAGLITVADVQSGVIAHALTFSSSLTCAPSRAGAFVAPAVTTDGWVAHGTCIPEGTRIRLSPTVDVATLPGLSPAERMIAVAMQRYGAYCTDSGGARIAFGAQLAAGSTARAVYARAGMLNDYTGLPHLPWSQLQTVRS